MKSTILTLFVFAFFFQNLVAQVFPTETLQGNGDVNKQINFVYVSEGYTAGQIPTFVTDATAVNNELFSQVPFSNYVNFFNAYAIKVPSTQSGADHPGTATDVTEPGAHPVQAVDTYFDATFDYFNIHRLLVPTDGTAAFGVLSSNVPQYDQGFILVNSPYYGGSGGSLATSSTESNSKEVAIHEIGHSFANLSDEYYAGDSYAAENFNMTQQTNPASVVWDEWYGEEGIGIYQHCCGGSSASWYRPHQNCKMRVLGSPFCAVCRQRIIDVIYSLVTPINSYTPANLTQTYSGTPLMFDLTIIYPVPNTLEIEWLLNGNPFVSNMESVTVSSGDLNTGQNTLVAKVTDKTTLSRSYLPGSGYEFTVTWMIEKSSGGTCANPLPLNCGDNIMGNTADGEDNIQAHATYSGYTGPELVYEFNVPVTSTVDIQLTGLIDDLDLFLLTDCNDPVGTELEGSENGGSSSEGINVTLNAGIYYIIADGYDLAESPFNLSVTCYPLGSCDNPFSINCGDNLSGNTADGANNIDTHIGSSSWTGPELIYEFTVPAGTVDIQLTGLSADLDLFLVTDCNDPVGTQLEASLNGSSSSESINLTVGAGTYYIIVDGFSGAESTFDLSLNCGSCSLEPLAVNDDPIASDTYSSSTTISSSGKINSMATVAFEAEQSITLTTGFEAQSGSTFTARIQACAAGVQEETIEARTEEVTTFKNDAMSVFPNPFQQQTTIQYQLGKSTTVSLEIYDLNGRRIAQPVSNSLQDAGEYQVTFQADDHPKGIYLVFLRTDDAVISKRLVLID